MILTWIVSATVIVVGWSLIYSLTTSKTSRGSARRVQVLVLGDIGRSPRMQYHALSLVRHGCLVDLVGYVESALHPDLQNNGSVSVNPLPPPPKCLAKVPFLIAGSTKVVWQIVTLMLALWKTVPPAEWIIVQNPPSIPTLHSCYLISVVRGSKVLVDWHNYGWTILAMTKGNGNLFVKAYKAYESFFGRITPTCNLAVTDAMASELRGEHYGLTRPIRTLHDRPAAHFQPIQSAIVRRSTLLSIDVTRPYAEDISWAATRLIVSSTSWTPDEDFSILLDAIVLYAASYQDVDDCNSPRSSPPRLVAVITGRGPQKTKFEALIQQLWAKGKLPRVKILTTWLPIADYAALLACADLGVCLHKSSSGVDLPMKVVDMFGAGLPVVAYAGYPSFGELVREGVNGAGFTKASQLADLLLRLLSARGATELAKLKRGAILEGNFRWDVEWDRVVAKELGL